MASKSGISQDAWLSEVMGNRSFRVDLMAKADPAEWKAALAGLPAGPGVFAYTKVDPENVAAIQTLEERGFRLVDTNIQLAHQGPRRAFSGGAFRVRFAEKSLNDPSRAGVEKIAEESFSVTRFHLDPRVPRATANRIKREWVANFYHGRRGDFLVVAETESGEPAGFLQGLLSGGQAVIDLIATGPAFRGKGAGKAMVDYLLQERTEPSVVGTQLANRGSLRFYQDLGYRVQSAKYVLHFHSGAGA